MWARPSEVAGEPSERVREVLAAEEAAGLHTAEGHDGFAAAVSRVRDDLVAFLIEARRAGKTVVGYGAPGKGNTLLNYCGIRPDLLAYTVDRNPYKHGRFTPGTRIPVLPPERIATDRPGLRPDPAVEPARRADRAAVLRARVGRPAGVPDPGARGGRMKVVLFCGGYGMRMRDGVSDLPKPMHPVGPRPLIWHVMRYYAHFGHTDFVLCLGYGAHHIKDFFLNYSETASNDFVLRGGDVELLGSDIQDWTITFVHTGLDSPIGERLRRVRRHVEGEEMFLANYADVLTDLPLDEMIGKFAAVRTRWGRCWRCRRSRRSTAWTWAMTTGSRRSPRCRRCRCGRTAATSCCARRSSSYLPENGDLIADACAALAKEGRMMAYRAPRVLAARRHGQGTHRAGGRLPERHPARGCSGTSRPAIPTATPCRPPSRRCRAGRSSADRMPSR